MRSEFRNRATGLDQIGKDFGKYFVRGSGERKAFAVEGVAGGPLGESGDSLESQLPRTHSYAHLLVLPVMEIASSDNLAVANKRYFIASYFDFAEEMRIQENGRSAVALSANDVAHEPPAQGVKPRGWFIEENDFGIMDKGLSQADALEHALGKTLQPLAAVGAEAYQIQNIGYAFAQLYCTHAAEAAVKFEQLSRRKPLVKAEIFGQKSNLATDLHFA